MNFRIYGLVLVIGLLVGKQAAALNPDCLIAPACFAVGVLANVFASEPKSIVEANAYSVVGLASALTLVKPLSHLNPYVNASGVLGIIGSLGLGFAIGRLANTALRFLSNYGFASIFRSADVLDDEESSDDEAPVSNLVAPGGNQAAGNQAVANRNPAG